MWLHVPGITPPSAPEGWASTSASDSLSRTLAASCTWRTSSRLPSSWSRVLRTVQPKTRLSGLTCEQSILSRGVADWMESLPASRARPTRSPGRNSEPTIPATNGQPASDSYEAPNLAGPSLRTWEEVFGDTTDASDQTLRALATGTRRRSSRRRKSARPTGENDSSFSPTPSQGGRSSKPGLADQAEAMWPTARAEDAESAGNHPGVTDSLTGVTRNWSTPREHERGAYQNDSGDPEKPRLTLTGEAEQWATPRTISGGGESGERKQELGREESGGGDLQAQAQGFGPPAARAPTPGSKSSPSTPNSPRRLNPAFVEWLMGWPEGWTSLEPIDSASPGTAWSLWWRRMHSELSRLISE